MQRSRCTNQASHSSLQSERTKRRHGCRSRGADPARHDITRLDAAVARLASKIVQFGRAPSFACRADIQAIPWQNHIVAAAFGAVYSVQRHIASGERPYFLALFDLSWCGYDGTTWASIFCRTSAPLIQLPGTLLNPAKRNSPCLLT